LPEKGLPEEASLYRDGCNNRDAACFVPWGVHELRFPHAGPAGVDSGDAFG
jgi:hypothetical protein